MGLGGTAKKLQRVVDVADELYAKVNDLRDEIVAVRNSIDETTERVAAVEEELDEQRELLERLAEAEGVDTTIESTDGTPGEPTGEASKRDTATGEATGDPATDESSDTETTG